MKKNFFQGHALYHICELAKPLHQILCSGLESYLHGALLNSLPVPGDAMETALIDLMLIRGWHIAFCVLYYVYRVDRVDVTQET